MTEAMMEKPITLTLIKATPEDLPYAYVEQVHHNISMFPDRRARQCQREYMEEMAAIEAELLPHVGEEDKEQLTIELEAYRQGYLKHWRAILDARSRTASSFITGPSNFPTKRNQKRLDTEQKRYDEFVTWKERSCKKLNALFNPQTPRAISSDRADAIDALRAKLEAAEKLQVAMVAANKIIRGKGTDDEKIERLAKECSIKEETARILLAGDYMGRKGFVPYATQNNSSEIRRLRQRIKDLEIQKARPERQVEFEGGYMLDNPNNNRVQIFYDDRPDTDTIAKLKQHGFRYSPQEGSWQRQRTNAGLYDAEQITGAKFE